MINKILGGPLKIWLIVGGAWSVAVIATVLFAIFYIPESNVTENLTKEMLELLERAGYPR